MRFTAKKPWAAVPLAALLLCCAQQNTSAFVLFTTNDGKPFAWNPTSTVIHWSIDPGAPPILRESMLYAIQTWNSAVGDVLTFK